MQPLTSAGQGEGSLNRYSLLTLNTFLAAPPPIPLSTTFLPQQASTCTRAPLYTSIHTHVHITTIFDSENNFIILQLFRRVPGLLWPRIWSPQNKGSQQINQSTSFHSSLDGKSRQGTHHVHNKKITSRKGWGKGRQGTGIKGIQSWLPFSGLDLEIFSSLYSPSTFLSSLLPQRADDHRLRNWNNCPQ